MQVVTAVNQQLGELGARKAELQHELGVTKERWQTEEAVRIRSASVGWAELVCTHTQKQLHTVTLPLPLPCLSIAVGLAAAGCRSSCWSARHESPSW